MAAGWGASIVGLQLGIGVVSVVVAVAMVFILVPALGFGYVFARYANLFARIRMLTRPLGVSRAVGWVATLVFFVGFAWLSIAGTIPEEGDSLRYPAVFAILGFALGLFGVVVAAGNYGRYRRLQADAFVSGTAVAEEETTEAPLSGESCLVWAARVREHSGLFRRGPPPTIHRDCGGTTFVVRTPTERVRVDPSEGEFEPWPVGRTDADFVAREREDAVPDRVRDYAADHELGESDRSRISEEARIEEGDAVTVFATEDRDQLALRGPEMRILDQPVDEVRERTRRRVTAGPAGVALAALSFAVAAVLSGAV